MKETDGTLAKGGKGADRMRKGGEGHHRPEHGITNAHRQRTSAKSNMLDESDREQSGRESEMESERRRTDERKENDGKDYVCSEREVGIVEAAKGEGEW